MEKTNFVSVSKDFLCYNYRKHTHTEKTNKQKNATLKQKECQKTQYLNNRICLLIILAASLLLNAYKYSIYI